MASENKAVEFSVPPVDFVHDLHGDPCQTDLTLFFNGNQWMVIEELLAAFRQLNPEIQNIYYETLPPGVLAEQIRNGALQVGELTVSTPADIYTAGREEMETLLGDGFIDEFVPYAENGLALLIPEDNPGGISELKDLGRQGVRVSMPNPAYEGVGRLIVKALKKAGGTELVKRVVDEKVANSETVLTRIHHRETINWLSEGKVDVGPLWLSEAMNQERLGAPLDWISIPEQYDVHGRYFVAAVEKTAPHPAAARIFLEFMIGETARKIYADYGFLTDIK